MNTQILVTYASRAGATLGVAQAIGRTLAEQGLAVDVRSMQEVADLTPYAAVVAGSAVRDGKWLPEAVEFVRSHRQALAERRFAAFLVCITLAMPNGRSEQYRQFVAGFLQPVRDIVRPLAEGYFAGSLDFSKLSLVERLRMRVLSLTTGTPVEDYRDWPDIEEWAEKLAAQLVPG